MTLLKPYKTIDDNNQNPYEKTYTGTVVDNNDPKKIGRVKVNIDIWDYMTTAQLPWVPSENSNSNSASYASQDIPEIGSEVEVYFKNKDPEEPRFSGAGVTEATKCSLFDEDYPNTHGEKDSIGNFTMHNKRTGISVFHHNSGTEIQCDPDGSYTITGKSGAVAQCDANGNFTFKGTSLKIVADEEINMEAERIKLNAAHNIDLNSQVTSLNSGTNLKLVSPSIKASGNTFDFAMNSVIVQNMFQLMKGGSYTLLDPFSKCTVTLQDGIVSGVEFWGG